MLINTINSMDNLEQLMVNTYKLSNHVNKYNQLYPTNYSIKSLFLNRFQTYPHYQQLNRAFA